MKEGTMFKFFSLAAVGGVMTILLAGCAAVEKQDTEDTEQLLSAAGFNIKLADTPEKLASLQVVKQHKVVRRELSNGQLRFIYADATVCRCLYVGDEQAYQQYQKLAVRQENALMDQQAALDNSLDNWWAYDPDAY
jgi:hypothetical protein